MSTIPSNKPTKERASRIALDYYRRDDKLLRWKRILAVAALLVACGWTAMALVSRDSAAYFSPGPLAEAHSTWEQQCSACHVDFVAMRSDSWFADRHVSRLTDARCERCHAGPAHHASQIPKATCSSCHIDHRGRQASLVRVSDRTCTQCHADLSEHCSEQPRYADAVTRFDAVHHPPFQSVASDPGQLKFSHRRHLVEGMSLGPPDRADSLTLDKLPGQFRAQYARFAGADGKIKLDCSACHRLDAADAQAAGGGATAGPATGAYMLPVTYESHCRACHPLELDPAGKRPPGNESPVVVPHGLELEQVRQFVERAHAARIVRENPAILRETLRAPLPHKSGSPQMVTLRQQLDERTHRSLFHVQRACSHCHELRAASGGSDRLPQIEATSLPGVWFRHARFDHAAHRAIKCQECHADGSLSGQPPDWALKPLVPDESDGRSLLDNDVVLIPQLEKCVECHAPRTTQDGRPRGGARFDCVECHSYHDGYEPHDPVSRLDRADVPLGVGSSRRDGKQEFSLEEFLSGKRGTVSSP